MVHVFIIFVLLSLSGNILKSSMIFELKAEHYLPGGIPLANVIGRGGIANNDAAAIVPPAMAAGAAASAKVSSNPSKRQSLV